jgi:predicted DNA-binding transcriptional regulator YafY
MVLADGRSPSRQWGILRPTSTKRPKPGRRARAYSQTHRVLVLYDRLHRGETLRASAAAAELGVDTRTLQRDLQVLTEVLGAQLERVDEPEPGVRLLRERRRWRTTRWQVLAVTLGARMVRFLSGPRFDAEVAPLLSQLITDLPAHHVPDVRELQQKVHVIESGQKLYRNSKPAQRHLLELVDALLLDLPVRLKYLSGARRGLSAPAGGRLQVRALCMTVHRGAVYFVVDVLGGDRHVGKRILLALDRMADVTLDREAQRLPRPRDFRAAEFFATAFGIWTGDGAHRVSLRIAPGYAAAVQERTWHATQAITPLPGGALRVEMELGDLHEVTDWILGMGNQCKVEGPAELIDTVREKLEAALAQYEATSGATYSVAPAGQDGPRRPRSRPRKEREP